MPPCAPVAGNDTDPREAPARVPAVLVVILSGVVAALHVGKMPPAIPVLRDALGVTLVEAGFLLSLVQLAGMLVGVLAGLATDGIGLRRSVLAGHALLAVASFAGAWARHPSDLLLLRAVEGIGFLLVVLPTPGLIRQLVPRDRLARALGLWGAYMPAGTALALLSGPAVINLIGWQGLWVLMGAVSAAMLAWLLVAVPSERQRSHASTAAPPAESGEPWWLRLRATLTRAGPWRVAIAFAMYSGQWLAVIGFLPSIYAQAGFSGPSAGALTAPVALVNVTGNIAAGRLLHRGVSARSLLYVGFGSMAIAACLAFSPLLAALSGSSATAAPVLRYLSILLFSAVGGLIPGTLFSLAVHVAPSERTVSTTVGWTQQCSSAGQFLGPPLVAWIAGAAGGWQWTWVATGIASLVGLLLARGFRRDPAA
jgi:MFS family permease